MSWRAIVTADVLREFNPKEQAQLVAVQQDATALATILSDVAAAFIGAMAAASYPVNTDGTVPDQLRPHVISMARWRWIISLPKVNEAIQSDSRKAANAAAEAALDKIANKTFGAIEAPAGTVSSAGNWNSENRLILRTHPVPPASQQFPPQTAQPGYANPDAPADN